jgi:hypothetical protein
MFTSRAARCSISLLTIMIGSGASLRAQTDGVDYEKILLPVVLFQPVAGAADSLWTTDFWIRNGAGQPVSIYPYDWLLCSINVCVPEVPPPPPTPQGISFRPITGGDRGLFLFVDRRNAGDVSFELRCRDTSRQGSTWGTEIPVVRESQFRSGRLMLMDVPTSSAFRRALRIYGLRTSGPGDVVVRIYGIEPGLRSPFHPEARADELLGEAIVHLNAPDPNFFPVYPLYADVGDLGSVAPVGSHERIAVEVAPLTPELPIWAFISVVHNETQNLTVISPH